jgi:serine beta-lactamase-like protein LACTB
MRSVLPCWIPLVLAMSIGTYPQGAEGTSNSLEAKADRLIGELMERQGIPGLSIAIGRDGDVVMAKGYGLANVEHQVPVKPETLFRTASICKMFTAVAVLQLAEEGKLDLDTPVCEYFPELDKDDWTFTCRQLLGHLAGVRHYKYPGENNSTRHFPDVQSALTTFVNDPLLSEPGTEYRYSSFGYNLLGAIVERRSGVKFDEYLRDSVSDVAGMTLTQVDHHYRILPNRAAGYMRPDRGRGWGRRDLKQGELYNAPLHDTSVKVAGGGMVSTPTDLVRFADALAKGKLFSDETLTAMTSEQQTTDGKKTAYGLGCRLLAQDPSPVVGHSGGQAGVSTYLILDPRTGDSVAIMCNLEDAELHGAAMKLLALAVDETRQD